MRTVTSGGSAGDAFKWKEVYFYLHNSLKDKVASVGFQIGSAADVSQHATLQTPRTTKHMLSVAVFSRTHALKLGWQTMLCNRPLHFTSASTVEQVQRRTIQYDLIWTNARSRTFSSRHVVRVGNGAVFSLLRCAPPQPLDAYFC